MRRIACSLLIVLVCGMTLPSCKKEKTEEKKDTTVVSDANTLKKADSLLAEVNKEWDKYMYLDSIKYKDLKGVYFQLKNIPTTNLKQLATLEATTKAYEAKDINLNIPNFVNTFFAYDSLLMIHVREVIAFSEQTKGAENLAVLQQLNKSLTDAIDDNLFVATQSHIDLAVVYYNEYLKAHPEVSQKDPKHKPLPEFGSIDRKTLKPIL